MRSLERDIMDGCETAKRELGYNPTRFLQMVQQYGVYQSIKKLIAKREPSEGYTRLLLEKRTELSIEFHVVKYAELFDEDELQYCRGLLETNNIGDSKEFI